MARSAAVDLRLLYETRNRPTVRATDPFWAQAFFPRCIRPLAAIFVRADLSPPGLSADHKDMGKTVREPVEDPSRESELSEIRTRAEMVTRNENRRGSEPPSSWAPGSEREPASGETSAWSPPSEDRRSVRIAQKISRAEALFRHLSDDDPRARLLRVAVLRNDEVLLDALLRRLDSLPPRRDGG
jgi:hypothetical protein